MKKIAKLVMLASVLICVLSIASFAAVTVDYSLKAVDEAAGQYDLYINVKSDGGPVGTFATNFTFNNEILIPADCSDYSKMDLATVSDEPIYPAEIKVGKKTYSYALADNTWKTNGNKTQLNLACYSTDAVQFDISNLDIVTISFVLADGKKITDLKTDDFVIDMIYARDNENGAFGYNEPNATYDVVFTNNVVPAAPVVLTIPVTKGDAIYFANGTMAVANSTGDYKVPADDGIIVVNTGYEAQKVYEVANGKLSERTDLADGVLATPGVSIRKDAKATGVRFKSSFLTSLKANVKEYGYIVTVESAKNALPEFGYTLDMKLVEAGKAKKGVGYSKEDGTDIFYDVDGARTVVTMVAIGIPLTGDAVTTNIVARPYYILENGAVVYGETNTASAYQIACAVRAQGGEIYENNKEYVDAIIALVPSENEGDNIIDTDYLFS